MGELEDRAFLLVDESTGRCESFNVLSSFKFLNSRFITARQKPKLVHVESHIENETLEITVPGNPKLVVDLKKVVENGRIIRAS